ncbi:MAG: Ig-like domain-containing protein [Nitrospira sp.]|nr:Ig-like domain-containing protein [Nitrospira sp.]
MDAEISVSGNSPGNAQITASLNGTSATSNVTVTPAPPTVISVLLPTNPVTLGATTEVTVTISSSQPTDTTISVVATPSGIIIVPATVTVPAGQTTSQIPVDTSALGTAMVRASLNATSAEAAVQVVPPSLSLVSLLPLDLSVVEGATGTLTVSLNATRQTNTVVTLEVDNASLLLIPSSVTVPAGEIDASFTVTGQAQGDAEVTASLNESTQAATIHIIPPPPTVVSLLPNSLSIQAGATGSFTLTINAAQPSDTSIPLNNSSSSILQAPSSVIVPAGETSMTFPVFGLGTGSATLTASLNSTTASATVQITSASTIVTGLTPGTLSLPKGRPGVLHVAVSPTSSQPRIVSLSSNNTTVSQVPATVTIPAGGLGADFPVLSVAQGQATITATLGSGSANAVVNVTAAELVTITLSPDAPTIFVGETLAFTATGTYTDGTTQNITASVNWNSSNQAVATIDTSGVASAMASGTTTITATSGSISGSTVLTVNVPPPPTISDFTPTSGPVGTEVTITGTNFGSTSTVFFNGVQATISSVTSTTIITNVPAGATTGPITVTTAGGSTTSSTNFTVTIPPIISNFSPTSGPIGTSVTINGQHFDPVAANNQVKFNGTSAIITSATSTTIQTTVPMGATTGPITGTTSQGTGTSSQPFEVTLSSDFSLIAQPTTLTILQGGSATAIISLSSTGPEFFAGLAALTVSGLPAGVTAVFDPTQITSNQDSSLHITVGGSSPISNTPLTVTGSAEIDGQTVTRTASFNLNILAGGQTSVSGQFLTTDGEPIPNIQVRIGPTQTQTDGAGNFLLVDIPAGTQQMMIDANAAQAGYPIYAADVTLISGQTTVLPVFRITPPPPPERFTPINNATADQVITDSRFPGVEITLPAGVTITGWDGIQKTQMAIERLSPDKLPVPSPPGPTRSAYQLYFGTPMGGVPSAPLPVTGPNDLELKPGEQAELWYYDASPMGDPAGWRLAGMGTVSEDGSKIVSDPGVGIERFCGVCGLWCWIKRVATQVKHQVLAIFGGEPVDLGTGLFIVDKTDLVLPGRLPVTIGRSYNTLDPFGGIAGFELALGQGWYLSTDVFILQQTGASLAHLIMPGNARVDLTRQPDGTFQNTNDPFVSGAVLSTLTGGDQQLRFKDGSTWRFRSLAAGVRFLIEMKDRNGNQVTIERGGPSSGISRIIDSAGRAINFTYSGSRLMQIQDPLGRTVQYTYNTNDRLETVTDPEGGVTTYTYDTAGRILTITDARNITFIENFYGPSGRVLRQVQVDGGEWRFRYHLQGPTVTGPGCPGPSCPTEDSWENLQASYNVQGGEILATTVVDSRGSATTHRFNNTGFGVEQVDALGQKTITTRNANNQVVATTDSLGRTTSFTYDTVGNVTSITDPEDNTTTFTYEPTFNRVTSITDDLGNLTTFEYDANGNLIATTDPEQNLEPPAQQLKTLISYNSFGQPISVTDPLGNVTQFEYDSVGNLVQTIDPLGNTTQRAYDAVSRLINLTDPLGRTTQFSYDDLNRVTQITDALNGLTEFTYDENGNLLTVEDAKDQTTTYTYDNMDRLETRKDPLNRQETYTYDLNGNLKTFTDRKSQQSIFTYDALNRRIQTDYADASRNEFAYDAVGRLVRATDTTSGAIEFTYDSLDRLGQEVTPQGIVTYEYDDIGRRTNMTVNGQAPVGYQYDTASRLTQVAQGTQVAGLAYDANGRRTTLTYPNGVATSYSYDTASRLTNILHQGPSAVIELLTYTYDAAGNRIAFDRTNGTATLLPDTVQAAYDAANEQIQFNSATPNLTYDANGNLASQTDANGTTTYSWDARNRLTTISGGVAASFVYDSLGRRVSKTINASTTQYLYDGNDIVQEIGSSAVATTYLRSLNIDEMFGILRQDGSYFSIYDGLGSTLALTDQSGTSVVQYTYDPFGNTQSTNSTFSNPFQYTGRENDGTGLYYYRARYYHPQLHRFISEDPIGFIGSDADLYKYVFDNPVNFVDPNGLCVPLTPDVILDVGFILYDLARLAIDGRKGVGENLTALTADLVGACTPALTGLGLGVRAAKSAIKINEERLGHVLERHAFGSAAENASKFAQDVDIPVLIKAAENVPPTPQASGGKFQRIVDAGRPIGIDKTTGQVTSKYTVIANSSGDLVTAFPGLPTR